jgi:hypothetical protein
VAHTHYPRLRPIVTAIAERHGLPCHDLGDAASAIKRHFTFLKALGAEGSPPTEATPLTE